MNERLKILVDSRRIEPHPAADHEIATLWEKAVRALRSSRAEEVDTDSAFSVAYNAAFQGAAAVLLGAGYRAVGRDHHHSVFAGVAALEAGELSRAARDADDMRQDRHGVFYGSVMIETSQLAEMQGAAGRLLAAGHAWLAQTRPELKLAPPAPPSG